MRDHFRSPKKITEATQHDIKLELDLLCQKRIERILRRAFPRIALLGEEGMAGDPKAEQRWVVDPIDGTVNFTYGIPHACVSIALQVQSKIPGGRDRRKRQAALFEPVLGVVYDPFCDELWTAVRGGPARLNGRTIRVSDRTRLDEAIVSLGFAKQPETFKRMLPVFNHLIHRVRKIRMMGAAALAMVYVASGRLDAYTEYGVRLWDIAAGGLILECAGGEFWRQPVAGEEAYYVIANNGRLRRQLAKIG
jgi:myo-inositol-1(or 4)-monophosphatase